MEWNNYKKPNAGCDIYGAQRLKLAAYLRDSVFPNINHPCFIENGTLLGAWRNSKFIPHDDDFDFAMLIEAKEDIKKIFKIIKKFLPDPYDCRIVNTYADKIEIYDPS